MKQSFHVENIKCGWCMSRIKEKLLEMPGVKDITIDKNDQCITIDGDYNSPEIIKLLTSLWYPPAGTWNLVSKAKSYVSCAIGSLSS